MIFNNIVRDTCKLSNGMQIWRLIKLKSFHGEELRLTFKKYPTDRVIGISRNTEVLKYMNLEYTLNYKSCIMCANMVKNT